MLLAHSRIILVLSDVPNISSHSFSRVLRQGDQIVRFLADCAILERSVQDDLVCESPPLGVRFSSSKVAVLAVFGVSAKV